MTHYLTKEEGKPNNYRHGDCYTRFYRIWAGMKTRGTDAKSNTPAYKHVKVEERWKSYPNFKEDMYEAYLKHCKKHGEKNTSIDRMNNNEGYSLKNCRWATSEVQIYNRAISCILVLNGRSMSLFKWAKKFGVSNKTLYTRIKRGWSNEEILTIKFREKLPSVLKKCENCGKEFLKAPSQIRRVTNHFCCHPCSSIYQKTSKRRAPPLTSK